MKYWDDDDEIREPSLAEKVSCWVLLACAWVYFIGQFVRGCTQ
jgi:hypothetical protein